MQDTRQYECVAKYPTKTAAGASWVVLKPVAPSLDVNNPNDWFIKTNASPLDGEGLIVQTTTAATCELFEVGQLYDLTLKNSV